MKFKLKILLCFHFEAQIHGKLQNRKETRFIFKDEHKYYDIFKDKEYILMRIKPSYISVQIQTSSLN